jgi:pimeloyl-ACP methyl ester carboxylesterase
VSFKSTSTAQLYYDVHGDGEPLILIPGLAAGRWIWFKQIQQLSEQFRVITFDPRGVGLSPLNSDHLTIPMLADDVAELLRVLGIERAHVLGASFGGFVAQEFALAHPEMTSTLVLACTSFGGPGHVPPALETLTALASMEGFNTEERVRRNLLPAFAPDFAREYPEEIEQVVRLRLASSVAEEGYRAQLTAAVGFNAEPKLGTIKAPTLVLSGDSDAIVPVQNSRNLASKIPRAELRIVEGGSHLFFIEHPEEFNRIVVEFLVLNKPQQKSRQSS